MEIKGWDVSFVFVPFPKDWKFRYLITYKLTTFDTLLLSKPISGKKNFHALNKDKNNTKNVINTQYKQRKNAEADKNKIIR